MNLPVLNTLAAIQKASLSHDAQRNYLAMYSSIFYGITTNPSFMVVPVDDHLVHRGDGVFEAFKMVDRKIYLFDAHLDRMERSAKTISLNLLHSREEIREICRQLVMVAEVENALFRLYASRGPGGFSPNPYESVGPQLYIILNQLSHPNERLYERGVKVGFSKVAIKNGGMAQTKTCNYVPNVMMNMEAKDRALDYVINVTSDGYLGEGAAENVAYLTAENDLIFSSLEHTLRGTTLLRLQELSGKLVEAGLIREMKEAKQSADQLFMAREAFVIGTTLDVLPITQLEGKSIGDGKPGDVARAARHLLKEDQISGKVSLFC